MIGYYNYTVIATYTGVSCAAVGIYLAMSHRPAEAVFCLLACGILDMFDGKIARTCKTRSRQECVYGIQIDSLSDLVAFGVLPAVIGAEIYPDSFVFCVSAIFYILCALIRLSYFNTKEEARQEKDNYPLTEYTGLPVTTVSFIIPVLWCFSSLAGNKFRYIYAGLMFIFGLLFVSEIKIRKPKHKEFIVLCFLALLILSALIILYIKNGVI